MAHASTFTYRTSLSLLGLVLMSVCALSPREALAKDTAYKLTVNVSVTDDQGNFIQSGTVTIKRSVGTAKTGEIVKGNASIEGSYLMTPDYQVTVISDGYKQSEPPPMISLKLLQDAVKGNKVATLDQPIEMLPLTRPDQSAEVSQLLKQIPKLLPKHPELLDAALQHVDEQPELQKRVIGQVKAGQHTWVKSIARPTRSIWNYWWILALPLAFAVGLLFQRIRHALPLSGAEDGSVQQTSGGRPALSSQLPAAPHVSTNQGRNTAETSPATLEAKVDWLVAQQLVSQELLRKAFNQRPPARDDSGVMLEEDATPQERADRAQWVELSTENIIDPARQFDDLNEYAQSYYRSLVREGQISPAPKYLDAELKSSPHDLVGDKQVVLQEVTHMQGAFVLFADESGKGLVFPNPQLNFSLPALRPVFPQLTASDFNSSKETIAPVPVTRVSDDRWRVERKS